MHIRAEGSTPYEIARQLEKYPQQRILAAADLVQKGPEHLPRLVELLNDSDSAVRYWAVVALGVLGSEAAPASEALIKVLDDRSPNVRFAAAGALCNLGLCEDALAVLAEGLEDQRRSVILHAARVLQSIGNKAHPLIPQMQNAGEKCLDANGMHKDNMYSMFICWALEDALENCRN